MVQPGLEHSPAAKAVPVARAFNDRVAEAIAAHPDRFAGFAALPTADPAAAADELARAVGELGFKGALVNGRTHERFLDDQFFWPIFESAEALGVPIYLHPMPPPKAVYDAYYAGFGDDVGLHARRAGLGLAHRDRAARAQADPGRRVRPLPRPADDHRAHGRGDPVHARAHRRDARRRHGARAGRRSPTELSVPSTSSGTSTSRPAGCSPTRRCAARSTRSAPTRSCSRSTIRSATAPWHGGGSTGRRSATRSARRSRTRTRSACSDCDGPRCSASGTGPWRRGEGASPRPSGPVGTRGGVGDAGATSPGGCRTTKPENSPPPRDQRVPPSASATVSNRHPATSIHTWPALAYTVIQRPGPGSPQLSNAPETIGEVTSPAAASA